MPDRNTRIEYTKARETKDGKPLYQTDEVKEERSPEGISHDRRTDGGRRHIKTETHKNR
jgi:hypothetical protein